MRRTLLALLTACAALASTAGADVLELKSGAILDGRYMGGTATTVRFEVQGEVRVVQTSELVAVTFTAPAAGAPAPPPPAAAPPPAQSPAAAPPAAPAAPVTLAAGTALVVRLKDGVSSKNEPGTPFSTVLEYDLVVGGAKVLPAGTLLRGVVKSSSEARRLRGQSTLDLRLNQVVLRGEPVAIVSSAYQVAGESTLRDAARGAAAGAAIGAIADGGEGAGKGAAIGAVAGALKRGDSITLTPGTMLRFELTAPVTLPASK